MLGMLVIRQNQLIKVSNLNKNRLVPATPLLVPTFHNLMKNVMTLFIVVLHTYVRMYIGKLARHDI